jgi:NADH-quinone oxidoreductase subunit J
MFAAIALTLRARKDSKYVDPADQVRVKARDRMEVLKMAPTLHAGAANADTAEGGKK